MRITDTITDYLRFCTEIKRLSEHSIRSYRFALNQFAEIMYEEYHIKDLETVRRKEIEWYTSHLNEKYAPASARHHYVCVSGLFSWAAECEILEDNPFDRFHLKLRSPKRLPRSIVLDDVRNMIRIASEMSKSARNSEIDYFCALRRQLMIELLLRTGIRIHELCGIELSHIDMRTQSIRIIGKGNKERKCYLTGKAAIELLELYINVRKNLLKQITGNPYDAELSKNRLMISMYGMPLSTQAARKDLHRISKAAGIKTNITPHMFRHTFATMLVEQGVELSYIQKYLGHSSIATTQIYLHIGDEAARKVLEDKFPEI